MLEFRNRILIKIPKSWGKCLHKGCSLDTERTISLDLVFVLVWIKWHNLVSNIIVFRCIKSCCFVEITLLLGRSLLSQTIFFSYWKNEKDALKREHCAQTIGQWSSKKEIRIRFPAHRKFSYSIFSLPSTIKKSKETVCDAKQNKMSSSF